MTQLYLPSGGSVTVGQKTGSRFLSTGSTAIGSIKNVPDDDMPVIRTLLDVWARKYPRNLIRTEFVDARENFKDFGISIPATIKSKVEAMIGWPAKAVRSLADMSVFEGFSVPQDAQDLGIDDIAEDNALDTIVPMLISSAYTHSCAFLTVSTGDDGRVYLMPRSADWSSAIWDRERRRIRAALTITSDDEYGNVTGFNVWLADKVYSCHGGLGTWEAQVIPHRLGRPPVVAFTYDAQLNRPFGRSRVSRPLMALTDIAFRTIVRMEASAEFYAVPKLWFLGADRDAFSADTWSSLISAINAISKDEDGDKPELKQVSQMSMQPHSDMLKTIALMVASETNIPVSDLGITTENPASAEAMAVAERKLSREADRQNKAFGRAIKDAVGIAIQSKTGSAPPESFRGVAPVWAPTLETSAAMRADAFTKIASVAPAFAQTEVGWRHAGFTQSETTVILDAMRKSEATSTLDKLLNGVPNDDQSGRGQAQQGTEAGGSAGSAGDAATVQRGAGDGSGVAT